MQQRYKSNKYGKGFSITPSQLVRKYVELETIKSIKTTVFVIKYNSKYENVRKYHQFQFLVRYISIKRNPEWLFLLNYQINFCSIK